MASYCTIKLVSERVKERPAALQFKVLKDGRLHGNSEVVVLKTTEWHPEYAHCPAVQISCNTKACRRKLLIFKIEARSVIKLPLLTQRKITTGLNMLNNLWIAVQGMNV